MPALATVTTRKHTADVAAGIVALYAAGGGDPSNLFSEADLAAFKVTTKPRHPSEHLFHLGLTGVVAKEVQDAMLARSRGALRAAAPEIARMLVEKAARGKECPYDRETLMFLAKSLGVAVETAKVSHDDRRKIEQEDEELRRMSTDDIRKIVLGQVVPSDAIAPLPDDAPPRDES